MTADAKALVRVRDGHMVYADMPRARKGGESCSDDMGVNVRDKDCGERAGMVVMMVVVVGEMGGKGV